MTEPEMPLQRITIAIDIDEEPGYEHVATGALLGVPEPPRSRRHRAALGHP
jgi:hypothetical protein